MLLSHLRFINIRFCVVCSFELSCCLSWKNWLSLKSNKNNKKIRNVNKWRQIWERKKKKIGENIINIFTSFKRSWLLNFRVRCWMNRSNADGFFKSLYKSNYIINNHPHPLYKLRDDSTHWDDESRRVGNIFIT